MSEPTERDKRDHALSMIREKIRAGLICCDEWPPPGDWPDANKLLLLDRLAAECLRQYESRPNY
jgi:hypothetical protein